MASRFEVTILGSSSATPTSRRFPTAQLLNVSERFFLIDCGEGTQIQLRRYKIRFQRINHIFISHLHGDHYLGLMGLISSMHLLGRKKELAIYSPKGLQEIIEVQLRISATELNYPVKWIELNPHEPAVVYEDNVLTVSTVILHHRIPCCGFVFREKGKLLSLDKAGIMQDQVPVEAYFTLKSGKNYLCENGREFRFEDYTLPQTPSRSYAFCSDTRFDLRVAEQVKNVNLLYHEATFMHDLLDRAEKTAHSTAKEAGIIARTANARKLVIGHFSVRYNDMEPLLSEAKTEFPETELAEEGKVFPVN
jgi:ribonuclease Z